MDEQQREAFKQAVERKQRAARGGAPGRDDVPPPVAEAHAPGDRGEQSIRGKSSGHGKKTADKWNQ